MKAQRQTAWGTRVAIDFFLNGTGAGLLSIGSILYLLTGQRLFVGRPVILAGLVILVAGLIVLTSELGRPLRMVYSLSNLKTSWLSRGVLFNALLVLTSLLLLFVVPTVPLAILLLVFSVLTAIYPSLLLYAAKDIRLWQSPLVIVLFLFWALAQGGAVINMLLPGRADRLLVPMLVAVALIAVLEGWFFGRKGLVGGDEKGASLMSQSSPRLRSVYRLSFVLGLPVPFVLYAVALVTLAPPLVIVGGSLMLVGAFFFRYVTLKAAYHGPLSVLHGKDVDKSVLLKRKDATAEAHS